MGTKFQEFLRNFRRNIPEKFSGISWGEIPEKFPGISRIQFSYEIPLKIRKHGDQFPRISQEFPEKYSGEILRNFLGENSEEFLRNFSKLSLKTVIPNKSLILGTNTEEFLENFLGISYRK